MRSVNSASEDMAVTNKGSGREPSFRRVRGFVVLMLLVVATTAGACGRGGAKAGSGAAATGPVPVEVVRAEARRFAWTVEYPATVLADKRAILVSKLPGEVVRVNVREGDRVKAGQVLVELDPIDIRIGLRQAEAQRTAAQAGVEMAEANLANLRKNHERLTSLHAKGTVSEKDFDQVEAGFKAATAQVGVAKAQLRIAEAAVLAARTNLDFMSIRAPFDGIVVSRMVDEGARTSAMPPTPLVQIVDSGSVKLLGGIPERAIRFVPAGADAKVFVEAISSEPIPAKVDRVEPLVDPRTRTANVRVVVQNADGRLVDGMSARVAIETTGAEAFAVPEDAIGRSDIDPAQGAVFVVREGRAHRIDVALGAREGDLVEVLSGLSGGELVIRGSRSGIREGQEVAVQAGQGG